ncbi:alpha amylase [Azorhizobium caulinodans ORS 571]|uniref:Alpha amylase n=1 Tax=Azorhizobium caulinodans (strain ATCC 43989 / DSM 5975 / JCM 20966 / LMG 6465 / NBRC 14845 / NCIMB 13405 / ORS 571) TaxID=438753 RepID=A8I1N7_AZOC5|nr:malto-oligosyltrehalose synthase [Azorhizobium caulinodans]BAF87402.1 alpha amylase [Azorhizobium caulinodans ORS 571]
MIPDLIATYRLQFHKGFTFADAEALVPYLAGLGVSHLYASPLTVAVPGSTHGYDVVDPTRINPELGGDEGFDRLSRALTANGMGLLLDIVPNHMAASQHNPFWMQMLECGPEADGARLFDVFWETGKLLLPVLGEPLRATLEAGAFSLQPHYDTRRIVLCYGGNVFPLRPESVRQIMEAAGLKEDLGALGIDDRAALEAALTRVDLAEIIEAQHWRLAWWRTAAHDLNYRRFFNITDLVGVRIEDREVFDFVHRLPLDLVRQGRVHGLRVDHVDGLADPAGYCARLRRAVGPDVPIFVEKILEPGEKLRPWPIDGTTGYERLNDINGVFVDEPGYRTLEEDLRARNVLVGTTAARLAEAKRQVLQGSLAAEVDSLAALARDGLDEAMREGDLTDAAIRDAVSALLVHCPVYRSYATWDAAGPEDEALWDAIAEGMAAAEDPLTNAAGAVLLDRLRAPRLDSDRRFRERFQQLSGPAMAKGFEDTELYRYPVLLCVNEVGGSLDHPARTLEAIHTASEARASAGMRDLIPLATHDTKRGPDTRARLAAISTMPDLWLGFRGDTREACEALAANVSGQAQPDALDQVMILQTLVSAWPLSEERVTAYLTKALREAKRHTNWETPNAEYEDAAAAFAAQIISAAQGEAVRAGIETLVRQLEPAGRIVGLAQTILQHTLPGTPDIYQGTEFRDFSLVDPDNRRPVDWEARRAALAGHGEMPDTDREKSELVRRLLSLRRTQVALTRGSYTPLRLAPSPWRWFGFERRHEGSAVRVIVPTRVPTANEAPASLSFEDGWGTQEWAGLDGAPLAGDVATTLASDWPFLIARARAS